MAPDIVQDLKLGPQSLDKEDIAVDSHGLISERDTMAAEAMFPHDVMTLTSVSLISVRRNSIISSPDAPGVATTFPVFLPNDRDMVQYIVKIYFDRLNFHRPVSLRHKSETALAQFYTVGEVQQHDSGFLCCVYLLFALGTLSELNDHACSLDNEAKSKAGAGTSPSSNVGAQSRYSDSSLSHHFSLF